MPKAKEKVSVKEILVNLLKAKVGGLYDSEPRPGMSLSQLEKLADEIINLF